MISKHLLFTWAESRGKTGHKPEDNGRRITRTNAGSSVVPDDLAAGDASIAQFVTAAFFRSTQCPRPHFSHILRRLSLLYITLSLGLRLWKNPLSVNLFSYNWLTGHNVYQTAHPSIRCRAESDGQRPLRGHRMTICCKTGSH